MTLFVAQVRGALSMWRHLVVSAPNVGGVGWRRMLVLVVTVLLASGVVWLTDAGHERTCTIEQLNGRRAGVCGSRLADLLRVVCRGVYNKRSADCETTTTHSL